MRGRGSARSGRAGTERGWPGGVPGVPAPGGAGRCGCRGGERHRGRGLAGLAYRLVTVGRRPQGIADGAAGHAVRIEADPDGAYRPTCEGTPP